MTDRIVVLVFMLMISISNLSKADVASDNAGEQAMISNLRTLIDSDPFFKNMSINIGAGVSGCKEFAKLGGGNSLNVLLTWQWLDEMKNLKSGTIVVTPEHAINQDFNSIASKVKIITIHGVLHNRTIENIQKENSALIPAGTKIIFMLAGDTQQADGRWVLFDKNMAQKVVTKLPKNSNIIILNGPRTGKHINENNTIKVDEHAHRDKFDTITQEVLNISSSNKSWGVHDFKYGQNSLWGPALKFCLENKEVILTLPGESTSMISEALSLGIKPVIYEHKAMTLTSLAYVKSLIKTKQASSYPDFGTKLRHQEPVANQNILIIDALKAITKKP